MDVVLVAPWGVYPAFNDPDSYYLVADDSASCGQFPCTGYVSLTFRGQDKLGHVAGVVASLDHAVLIRVTFRSHGHHVGVSLKVAFSMLDWGQWSELVLGAPYWAAPELRQASLSPPSWFRKCRYVVTVCGAYWRCLCCFCRIPALSPAS